MISEVTLSFQSNQKKSKRDIVRRTVVILKIVNFCLRNTLDHIDLEIDKAIASFGSDLSASEIWKPSVNVTDRFLISLKYLSNVIHKSARIVTDILKSGK